MYFEFFRVVRSNGAIASEETVLDFLGNPQLANCIASSMNRNHWSIK